MARKGESESVVTHEDLRRGLRWQEAGIILAILGSFGSGLVTLEGRARAETDAGVRPIQAQLDAVSARVEKTERDANNLRADVHEVQADLRSLYKAVMTGERQPRLEVPPVDGGPSP